MENESTDARIIRRRVESLIRNFEKELQQDDLRSKVLSLVPIFHGMRELGKSLIPKAYKLGAKDRILFYFRKYPATIIDSDELLVVSGIQEYARRIRELRVQFGWSIISGVTIQQMLEAGDDLPSEIMGMKPNQYILLSTKQDRDAAYRWNVANTIRNQKGPVRDKILAFLRKNVGKPVTNEELRYIAGNKTEWARRVRELRTEHGWPIATKTTGRPDLGVGVYVLQADRRNPPHDRYIPDNIRREVLCRDGHKCRECGWSHDDWDSCDPRHLELHHIIHHARGGKNISENLKTVCNKCHNELHRKK